MCGGGDKRKGRGERIASQPLPSTLHSQLREEEKRGKGREEGKRGDGREGKEELVCVLA